MLQAFKYMCFVLMSNVHYTFVGIGVGGFFVCFFFCIFTFVLFSAIEHV